jgi:hypothetical protein
MTAGATAVRPMPFAARGLVIALTLAFGVATAMAADPSGLLFFVAFAGTGAYLVIQRPRNSVGWFVMVTGYGLAIGSVRCTVPIDTLLKGELDPFQAFTAWANGCGWAIAFFGFYGITIVFPSGHLGSGDERILGRFGFGVVVALAVVMAVGPVITVTTAQAGVGANVPNPLAFAPGAAFWALVPDPSLIYVALFAMVVAGVIALIRRYQRSAGLERLQYRWLVTAMAFVAVANLIWAIVTLGLQLDSAWITWLVVLVAYPTVPIAILVAIMRYRLYDIDRLISRSIAYAGVLIVLAAVFGATVLALSFLLASFAQGMTIAVAGSTLITYALLQPVLGRIRRYVDRRFDRTRYDAELTAIAFADRLRSETNVEAVTTDLTATTRAVVAPSSTSLWIRPRGAER